VCVLPGIPFTCLLCTTHSATTDVSLLCRYLYITIVYNVTYSVALLALFMFYMGAHDLLAPFNPLLKFVLVKSVVFFTFWQVLAARMKVLDFWRSILSCKSWNRYKGSLHGV
jgi:Organic solute transporter Ostalpha